jgi:hypothetical protein
VGQSTCVTQRIADYVCQKNEITKWQAALNPINEGNESVQAQDRGVSREKLHANSLKRYL